MNLEKCKLCEEYMKEYRKPFHYINGNICSECVRHLEDKLGKLPPYKENIEWISVKDRLPEEGKDGLEEGIEDVLILYKRICSSCMNRRGPYTYIGYYIDKKWMLSEPLSEDIFTENHNSQIEVTHWMPLPELPEEFN